MPGTKAGAAKRRQVMIEKMGGQEKYEAYMKSISSKGGSVPVPKGFAITGKGSEAAKNSWEKRKRGSAYKAPL